MQNSAKTYWTKCSGFTCSWYGFHYWVVEQVCKHSHWKTSMLSSWHVRYLHQYLLICLCSILHNNWIVCKQIFIIALNVLVTHNFLVNKNSKLVSKDYVLSFLLQTVALNTLETALDNEKMKSKKCSR